MITNLPTPESLNNVALRIYYRAWGDLLDIWFDFSRQFEPWDADMDAKGVVSSWPNEWREYLGEAQQDLQSICSLLQQSMELALKARICTVSPYLLLLNGELKLSAVPKDIDFSELKTLDAVDLPGAVNTLTAEPVPDEFITKYTALRALRNKITHLGVAGVSLDPADVLRLAVALYLSMWPGRNWLADRLDFAAQTRTAWLHDGKYTSTYMEVLQEWPVAVDLLEKGEFKKLFGHPKSKRRYLCHHCVYEGDTRYAGLQKPGCGTAYLETGGSAVSCIMCAGSFAVERAKCPHCKGNVVGANGDDWVGYCHTCGTDVEEEVREVASVDPWDPSLLFGPARADPNEPA